MGYRLNRLDEPEQAVSKPLLTEFGRLVLLCPDLPSDLPLPSDRPSDLPLPPDLPSGSIALGASSSWGLCT